jgi:hypothetical protein
MVWVGIEGDQILVCTSDSVWKAKDMRRVGLSVADLANPYRTATLQGRVVDVRPDEGCRYMDPISVRYTGARFTSRGPDRVCFVIAVETAGQRTLGFTHNPASAVGRGNRQDGSPGVVGRRVLILECMSVRQAPAEPLHDLTDEVLRLELGGPDVLHERLPLQPPVQIC